MKVRKDEVCKEGDGGGTVLVVEVREYDEGRAVVRCQVWCGEDEGKWNVRKKEGERV